MITTAEEFVSLRRSNDQRAACEPAAEDVWVRVITDYPDMQEWVVLNKHVPISILYRLAATGDYRVRHAIAMKRKCPVELLAKFAKDECQGVRMMVARNPATPSIILRELSADTCPEIAEAANHQLRLSRPEA